MSSSVPYITSTSLASLLRAQASLPRAARPTLVYDVRDEDRAGGHLAQSAHVPSDEFLRGAHRFAKDAAAAGVVRTVAFHCTFSQVRGPRCAARFADALARMGGAAADIRVVVVEGGFKACAKLWPKERDLFEDFDQRVHSSHWED